MNILYIWDGRRKLPKEYLENLEIIRKFYPDSTIFYVTKHPENAPENVKIINWDEYLEKTIKYFCLEESWRLANVIAASDWLRFYFLLHIPNLIYLDFDVTLLKILPISDKFQYSDNNYCLMISPDNKDYQNPLLNVLKENIKINSSKPTYWIFKKFENNWSEKIDRSIFIHWN